VTRSKPQHDIPELLPFNKVRCIALRWGVSDKVVRDAIKSGRLKGFQPNEGMWLITGESVERAERAGRGDGSRNGD
jgi:hypothetical protein